MRVTNMMKATQLLGNLRYMNTNIQDLQNKLATGKRIHKPADDPVGVGYLMRYDTELSRNEEYLENVRTGIGILNTMDQLMQQANDVIKRAKLLAQQAANGTIPEDIRKATAAEMKQLREQLVLIGNSSYSGRYLFNGQKMDQPPYTSANAANDRTDRGMFYLNAGPSASVPVSITGEDIFGEAGSADNTFKIFDDVIAALESNDQDALINSLDRFDIGADRIAKAWAEIGARTNRFELMENRILDEHVTLEALKGKVSGVDMAEAIIQLKIQENTLQAALATGARINQLSLIDFI
jgi:flagellar hook-associated protein 3 FlgL